MFEVLIVIMPHLPIYVSETMLTIVMDHTVGLLWYYPKVQHWILEQSYGHMTLQLL